MVSRKKLSTDTRLDNEIVPWLAATGELAYSPKNPPNKDYYFQYSWVIPSILGPEVNKGNHYWFGERYKDDSDVQLLLSFWQNARRGDLNELFLSNGIIVPHDVTAPIGAYRHKSAFSWKKDSLILIQHGSYLITEIDTQPEIEKGTVILYRGIQNADIFRIYRIRDPETHLRLRKVHRETLVDSFDP